MAGSGSVCTYRGRRPTEYEISSKKLSTDQADLIIVDESNSFSSKGDGIRQNLTIVCTRVKDVRRYEKTAELIPSRKKVRAKYSNTKSSDRGKILKDISAQELTIVESHRVIDYSCVDTAEAKKKLYMGVLAEAVIKALDLNPDKDADIVLDTPPVSIQSELLTFSKHLEDTGRRVRWFETRSSASDVSLQIHDYVTGAVSDHVEGLDEIENYRIIKNQVMDG